MPRYLSFFLGTLMVVMVVGGPIGYAVHRQAHMRNFRAVRDGVLYRSGQMSLAGLKWAIHDQGIKTVITLRDSVYPGETPPDFAEERFCKAEEINYCRIPPRTWWAPGGGMPAAEEG